MSKWLHVKLVKSSFDRHCLNDWNSALKTWWFALKSAQKRNSYNISVKTFQNIHRNILNHSPPLKCMNHYDLNNRPRQQIENCSCQAWELPTGNMEYSTFSLNPFKPTRSQHLRIKREIFSGVSFLCCVKFQLQCYQQTWLGAILYNISSTIQHHFSLLLVPGLTLRPTISTFTLIMDYWS